MSSPQAARRRSNKTRPEGIDYDDQQLEILTSRAVLKKGPGQGGGRGAHGSSSIVMVPSKFCASMRNTYVPAGGSAVPSDVRICVAYLSVWESRLNPAPGAAAGSQ